LSVKYNQFFQLFKAVKCTVHTDVQMRSYLNSTTVVPYDTEIILKDSACNAEE